MSRVRLSVDIDPAVKHRLAVLAALRRTTISEIVVKAIQRTLAEDEAPTLENDKTSAAGALAEYADVNKRKAEDGAWLRHVAETAGKPDKGHS